MKASRDLMRDANTSLVINLVKGAGSLSRADLARESGLSPATVSGIVGRLIQRGIVNEVAVGPSNGGRPPVILRLNEVAGYVIGIKLRGSGLTTVITDLGAEVKHSREVAANLVGDPQAAIERIAGAVQSLLADSRVKRSKLLGIGLGLPGVVDASAGVCHYSHLLGWQNVPLQEPLRRRLKVPVLVDNDVNTLAVADRWFGAGAGVRHFLTVTVGRGVGLGIVINGDVYRGTVGGAGEFGHVVVADGPLCECGRSGCLEALVSEPALRKRASAALGRPITSRELVELASSGEPTVTGVLAVGGRQLGMAVGNLVALFNPERLIVSGEGTELGPAFFDPMIEAIRENTFADLGSQLDIVIEPWGDDAWAVGAATLVLRELFNLPIRTEQPRLNLLVGA